MLVIKTGTPRKAALVLGGLAMIAIGLVLVLQPGALAMGMIWFYGFFVLTSAIVMLAYDLLDRQEPRAVVQGISGAVIGALLMMFPDMTLLIAVTLIALWLLTIGLTQALHGILLRRHPVGLIIFSSGLFCIIMAIMLLFFPAIPLLALGYYLVIYGVVMFFSAFTKIH